MPTYGDETLHDRYAREHADHLARLAKMTPEQIAEMELSLHNAMAELGRLRAQPIQGGEAVEVVAVAFITRAEKSGPKIAITLKKEDAEKQHKNWLSMSKIITTEPLMTVAQHQRILAASVGSADHVGVVFTMEALAPGGGVKSHASLNRDLPAGTKLYTHPADQVADDLTMVKVSRELANIAALHLENSGYTETGKKLRALLNGGRDE